MYTIFSCLLTCILLVSCSNSAPPAEPVDSMQRIATARLEGDTLGPVIQRIRFSVAMTDQEGRLIDYVPWIGIEKAAEQLPGLKDADMIVLPYSTVKLIIDYSLLCPAVIELKSDGQGFSNKALILAISEQYQEIYKEEEATATTKTTPAGQRKELLNRNETDGKYGIWGHDLSDLSLSEIEVYQHPSGAIYLRLGIES